MTGVPPVMRARGFGRGAAETAIPGVPPVMRA